MLAYLDEVDRRSFVESVRALGAVWLANEAPGVVAGTSAPRGAGADFLLVRDGTELLARSDPHGGWVEWG